MDQPAAAENQATTNSSVDILFDSVPFGKVTLPNRVVMAPMTRNQSPGHVPNERNVEYYRRRAEGGIGLIITEGTNPGHPAASGYPDVPVFDGDEAMAGWKKIVDAVHKAGSFIIPQLWHCGSIRQTGAQPDPEVPGFGPSPVVHPFHGDKEDAQAPHEMTQKDIDDTVESFARSAGNAKDAGFDGVEIHGAHSYLIDQFFWEVTNKRTDAYGGPKITQRMRFAVEVVEAIRSRVGDDFPIVFRFSQWKQGDYTHKMVKNPDEFKAFLDPLAEAGVDWFHASNRRFWDAEFEGSELNLAGWCTELTGKPAITVGSVGLDSDFLRSYAGKESNKQGLDKLVARLENKEFELVAVGRALLSDAEWVNKVRERREDEIVGFEPKHLAVYP
ncbi:MAG: NADH:flavin oxidoreductase [Candidatus Hydrogenedentes bacterium]|nr:NADH:flavin oxidoreductase [Candidatus Hydrogenedentota bacterium]